MTDQSSPELLAIEATSTPPPGDVAWGAHTVYQRSDETTEGRVAETSVQTAVTLGGLRLRNPVMPASGCFGPSFATCATRPSSAPWSPRRSSATDARGTRRTASPRPGRNAQQRQHPQPGIDEFLALVLPRYSARPASGREHRPPARRPSTRTSPRDWPDPVAAIEVNVSCPNLERGGLEIGADPEQLA